jgi:hypothetical protein
MVQFTDGTALKNHLVYYFLMPAAAIPPQPGYIS